VSSKRVINFSAGPAVLPEEVLRQVQEEMLDWHGSGMSVMEMSHRGKEYIAIHEQCIADLRELLAIPANYKVLLLQGGATSQFAMIPRNLLRGKGSVDHVYTGEWSKKAIKEGKIFSKVNVVASSEDKNFTYVPPQSSWKLDPNAAYVHICTNETIGGVEFHWTPDTGGVPLVADMSSHFLSRPVDVSKYALIYAGAQKNLGPSGLTVIIVREDLIGTTIPNTATMFDYKQHAEADSMINTPPCFAIYVSGLVLQWIKRLGGLAAMEKHNIEKANVLYNFLDAQSFYRSPVNKADRSRMNIAFTLPDEKLDDAFLKGGQQNNLVQLKGHRSVGGMRASIYNAMPIDGVKALVDYMGEFARKHG
jgi:phosphoserine aminotransferase